MSSRFPDQLGGIAKTDLSDLRAVRAGGLALELVPGLLDTPAGSSVINVEGVDPDTVTALQTLYEKFETDLEYDFAEKIINGEARLDDYILYDRFIRLIQAEIELAGIRPEDRLLFIGSGPFPLSAILFAKMTGAKVTCFDISEVACEKSEMVIQKLGLEEQIEVVNESGSEGAVQGYEVIIMALLAQPKGPIMWNIWQHAPENSRLVSRESESERQLFYRGFDPGVLQFHLGHKHFRVVSQHHAQIDDTISSLHLVIDRDSDKF